MLVRNCFSAYKLGLQEAVRGFLQEENEVMKNYWYKLVVEKISLPDPYGLVDGWCVAPSHLPNTLHNNVQEYLMKYDPGKAFKSGEGLSGHLSDIKGAFSGLRQFLAIESPLKMMKMLFISPWKLFLFSKYLFFCLNVLVMRKSCLNRKISLISRFVTSQSRKQTMNDNTHIDQYLKK